MAVWLGAGGGVDSHCRCAVVAGVGWLGRLRAVLGADCALYPTQRRTNPDSDSADTAGWRCQPQRTGGAGEWYAAQPCHYTARVVLPDGSDRIFTLLQDGPGSYSQDILLPESGAYGIDVALERDGVQYRTTTGYVQPVSAEFLPPRPDDIPGDVLLQELAAITAGQVLDAAQLAAMLAAQQKKRRRYAQSACPCVGVAGGGGVASVAARDCGAARAV